MKKINLNKFEIQKLAKIKIHRHKEGKQHGQSVRTWDLDFLD